VIPETATIADAVTCVSCRGRGWKFVHGDGLGLWLVAGGEGGSAIRDCLACGASGAVSDAVGLAENTRTWGVLVS